MLTPLGAQLAGQIEEVCAGFERLFATDSAFRPEYSEREFTLLMPDYVLAALGEQHSRTTARRRPGGQLPGTPYFVAGTGRVAVMQRRLARRFADRPDLRVLDCPGDPPPIVETLWWHARHDEDDAHRWFRAVAARAALTGCDDGAGGRGGSG